MDLPQIINSLRPVKSGCWIFTRALDAGGYGVAYYDGKLQKVHRLVFALMHNITHLPEWAFICHKCDNPQCANPNHLFLGNAKINNLDKIAKGRTRLNNITYLPRKKQNLTKRAKRILANYTWNG